MVDPTRHAAAVLALVLALASASGQEAGNRQDGPVGAEQPLQAIEQRIPQPIEHMAEDDYAGLAASRELAGLGDPAVPALIDATEHSVPRVRYWSIAALSRIGDPAAVPAVRKCLQDQEPLVRQVAVWHLGRWFDRQDVRDSVVETLDDPNPFVRGRALMRIQASGYREAAPRIRTILENVKAEEPEVRYDALHALAVLEGQDALKTLEKVLRTDESPLLRECAVRCCTVVRPPTVQTGELMILALGDKDETVRRCAAELLRKGFNQYFGFAPSAEPPEREKAVRQWRDWYEKNRRSLRWSEKKQRFEIPGEESVGKRQAAGA